MIALYPMVGKSTGLYKDLKARKCVVSPSKDIDEACKFILSSSGEISGVPKKLVGLQVPISNGTKICMVP